MSSTSSPRRVTSWMASATSAVGLTRLQPQQEDLRQDRGLAEPADRGRASLRLPRWHRHEAHLGRRGAQRLAAGGDRGECRGFPRDPRHLRGRQGGQVRLVGVPPPPRGPRAEGRRADHLGRLQRPGREHRRVPAGRPLAALRGAFLPQRLQPRAGDQGPRGQPHAQGDPRPGDQGNRRGQGLGGRRRAPPPAYGARCGPRRRARLGDPDLLRLPGLPLDQDPDHGCDRQDLVPSRFMLSFFCAGDLVAKSGASAGSAAGQPTETLPV